MEHTGLSLWKTTLIAGAGSILANLIVLYFTKSLAPEFTSLSVMPVIFWTVIATLGAATVFALTRKCTKNPNRMFIRISLIALLLSFGMDIPLFFVDIPFFAGATPGGLWSLMGMHVVAATIIVSMLVRLTKATASTTSSIPNI
ncbi:MAG TPA: DUF6069 family protein [Candidatus Paceibacterota bacterium]